MWLIPCLNLQWRVWFHQSGEGPSKHRQAINAKFTYYIHSEYSSLPFHLQFLFPLQWSDNEKKQLCCESFIFNKKKFWISLSAIKTVKTWKQFHSIPPTFTCQETYGWMQRFQKEWMNDAEGVKQFTWLNSFSQLKVQDVFARAYSMELTPCALAKLLKHPAFV